MRTDGDTSQQTEVSVDKGPGWSVLGLRFAVAALIVAVPDVLIIVLLSAIGFGPKIYNAVADKTLNIIGTVLACICAVWVAFLFIIDITDRHIIVQVPLGLVLVALACATAILKGISYPWAAFIILLFLPAVTLGLLRAQQTLMRKTASQHFIGAGKHFYKVVGCAFLVCGLAVLLVWLLWLGIDGHTWGSNTRKWLAAQNLDVYAYVMKDIDLSYMAHCNPETKNISSYNDKKQVEIESACTTAESVWFIQWCSPLVAFVGNMLCAIFSILFSKTSLTRTTTTKTEPEKRIAEFKYIIKSVVLILSLAVASLYCSLYVSGASVRLGSAILCGAVVSVALVLGWVFLEVDFTELKNLLQAVPQAGNIAKIIRSDWIRAVAVGSLSMLIPLVAGLDILRQMVRRCRDRNQSTGSMLTKSGSRIHEGVKAWNLWSIFRKVNQLAMLFVLMIVGTKATFVFFSALNTTLSKSGLGFTTIAILVFFIGLGMFLCPIVPGTAVYLFAGVVLGAQSQLKGSVGFWPGMVTADVVCSLAKLIASVGQYSIGYFAGKAVKVQQFVGVDKVPTRAMEQILKQPGMKLGKVCILVAGPDFPTSMLCGILKLNIPQMLLGTTPVILVSIIPQTLVGGLLTKGGNDASLWAMISSGVTGLAAAIQAGATLFFTWSIMRTIEKDGEKLAESRPEHEAVAKLTNSELEFVKAFQHVTKWDELGPVMQVVLLFSMIFLILSGFIVAADFILSEKICFRKFKITDSISADFELGGLNRHALNILILPLGAIALGLACVGSILHVAVGKRMNSVAKLTKTAPDD